MTTHQPDCVWGQSDCEYKETHRFCPHEEHKSLECRCFDEEETVVTPERDKEIVDEFRRKMEYVLSLFKRATRGDRSVLRDADRMGNISDWLLGTLARVRAEERWIASSEVRRILRNEVQDANKRIRAGENNPLYWLNRRFDQLADEIEDGEYDPTADR